MRSARVLVGVFCLVAAATPAAVKAAMVDFSFTLNGANEVAPVETDGTGAGWLELSTQTHEIQWSLVFSNLTGPPTAADFHGPAPAGQTAPPIVTINHTFSPTVGYTQITAGQAQDLTNGLWYVNICTEEFPEGEIRGQVTRVVPEPGTLAILAAGGLWGLRAADRRRARSTNARA